VCVCERERERERVVTFLCEYFTITDVVLKLVLIFAFDILGIDISLVKCFFFFFNYLT